MAVTERMKQEIVHLNHVQEAHVGAWVFAVLAFAVFVGGFWFIGRSDLRAAELIAALFGILTLAIVCAGLSMLCHLMVDLFEDLKLGKRD